MVEGCGSFAHFGWVAQNINHRGYLGLSTLYGQTLLTLFVHLPSTRISDHQGKRPGFAIITTGGLSCKSGVISRFIY